MIQNDTVYQPIKAGHWRQSETNLCRAIFYYAIFVARFSPHLHVVVAAARRRVGAEIEGDEPELDGASGERESPVAVRPAEVGRVGVPRTYQPAAVLRLHQTPAHWTREHVTIRGRMHEVPIVTLTAQ